MMKKLLYMVLLVIPCLSQGQINIYNKSLNDTLDNTLYNEISNIIHVTGIDAEKAFVTSTLNGTVNSLENNHFLFTPHGQDFDTLRVIANQQIVATKVFKLKRLCTAKGALGNIKDSVATVKQIIANPVINAITPGCDLKDYYSIVGYSIKFVSSTGKLINEQKEVVGIKLNERDLKTIKLLKPKDKIILRTFVTCRECSVGGLQDLEITII